MKRSFRQLRKKTNLKSQVIIILLLLILGGLWLAWDHIYGSSDSGSETSSQTSNSKTATSPTASFNKQLYPTDVASSLWVVVNKGRVLPSDYIPRALVTPNMSLRLTSGSPEMKLRSEAAAALEELVSSAKEANINLMLASGYRSYALQVLVHDAEVRSGGQARADAVSARPGHSEHQTGLAADVEPTSRLCELDTCFADTPEGKWLAASAYKYGFVIRYQNGKQSFTGYDYEPWHIRYVGKELAGEVYSSGITLEQFFNLPSYTNYPQKSLRL